MRILIVNVNLHAATTEGCKGIERAFRSLDADMQVAIQHWTELQESWSVDPVWDAFILGPNETPFPAYPSSFHEFLQKVRTNTKPLLGICGGHQVLGLAFGCEVGPVFDIPAPTTSYAGLPKIKGVVSLTATGDSKGLLSGLPREFRLDASHVEALERVPDEFRLIASTEMCKVQVMAHQDLPLFGVQCHPEREWSLTAGKRLLSNFLEIVDFQSRCA